MTIKQFLGNVKIQNVKYIISAKYKKFIKQQYNKYFSEDKMEEMMYKVSQCPKCYLNNSAECCGCNFKEMITTDKKCGYGKW